MHTDARSAAAFREVILVHGILELSLTFKNASRCLCPFLPCCMLQAARRFREEGAKLGDAKHLGASSRFHESVMETSLVEKCDSILSESLTLNIMEHLCRSSTFAVFWHDLAPFLFALDFFGNDLQAMLQCMKASGDRAEVGPDLINLQWTKMCFDDLTVLPGKDCEHEST